MPNTFSLSSVGLRVGIEIHQQLQGTKLFCSCPASLNDNEPDYTIERQLRASAGESGQIDIAASHEQQKSLIFIYQSHHSTNCLIELDSQPPLPLNPRSLTSALQLCKLTRSEIIPVIQVMRKIVVDGSNTSGFQRTALVGRGGIIETSYGTVRVANINIEEDSARSISEAPGSKTYRLDRLGIPLIEIGTAPDITTPLQAQQTAKKIGLLLRSLPGCKRGLGTIRQDLNVSISGGARIEIKGAQDLKMIPLWIELEAHRQHNLLKIKEHLTNNNIPRPPLHIVDLSTILADTSSKIIRSALNSGGKILSLPLPHFSGLLALELQPNYRLGTELSDHVKSAAGLRGLLHSDELPGNGITPAELELIKNRLGLTAADGFIIVADQPLLSHTALHAVHQRILRLWAGIPSQVRRANPDGTSSYLRPMPGSARLYPETDVPLIRPNIRSITAPETIERKSERYQQQFLLSADLANHTVNSDYCFLFEELAAQHPSIKPAFIAETLISTPTDIRRTHHLNTGLLTDDCFRTIFSYLNSGQIHKDVVIDVLIDMIKGTFDISKYTSLSTEDIHHGIMDIISSNPHAPFSALMGLCMKKFRGRASGEVISKELQRLLEHGHK